MSPRLEGRLTKAYELYKNRMVGNIIVSRGTGVEGIDEALTMKKYLSKRGVPENRIIADSNGVNIYNTSKKRKKIYECQ
ncbi:YdcF family protein [Desulfonema magnum]|uniref:DUF218 n=1 Tax=Desulfonema magnum TaxID=45655 RepID=A0A975BVJ4_9BACT|nr:YdcF family protein [Desulfonema magnum]QTA92536.1 DUF218 [Desulfonema magnum]